MKNLSIVSLNSKEDYTGVGQQLKFKCKKCENTFWNSMSNINKDTWKCNFCNGKNIVTGKFKDEVIDDLMENERNVDFDVLTTFSNKKGYSISRIVHNVCGEHFRLKTNYIKDGISCPFCNTKYSNGVLKIMHFLEDKGYDYIQEFTHKDCRNTNVLTFDFAIFLENVTVLIEFDGSHHFKPTRYNGCSIEISKEQPL